MTSLRIPSSSTRLVIKPKMRRCANPECRAEFEKRSMSHRACCPQCAVKLVELDRAKKERQAAKLERAATKKELEKFKPLSYFEKIAERHCNAYIRARDPDICISCGVTNSSAWQAGHYVAVGANSTLRYHEDNIHKQCVQCNMFKGSNAILYRANLIKKIGVERVEWLEGWHAPIKMTRELAIEIAERYKAKLKELKKGRGA